MPARSSRSVPSAGELLRRTLGASALAIGKPRSARFNEVQQKATHNSYGRDETIFDELVYHRVRALEFDLHVDRTSFATMPRDWFVYHIFAAPYDDTQCVRLSDCLRAVKTFHDTFPQHEVVTLWLDLKDEFAAGGHDAADLDAAIANVFGEDAVFRPRDLLRACPDAKSLRDAVAPDGHCGWPETKDLRGKIMVALTGGAACAPGSSLNRYLEDTHDGTVDRAAFIAPDLDASCTFGDYAHRRDVVVFNTNAANAWRTEEVSRAGLMSRIYGGGVNGGLDDPFAWNAARAHRANFLATNRVNEEADPWASTQSKSGWPFLCLLGGCEPNQVEEGELVGVTAESGDIEGTNDSFYFLEADEANGGGESPSEPAITWSSAIAVPSSNVERWAKGCLMARATRDADSPYFAVCRPADNARIRVQYRLAKGGPTEELEAPRPWGLSAESTFFARLELTTSQGGTTASSSSSTDGVSWNPIAARSFETSLAHQGLAASSHGSNAVRFLFANLKRGAETMGIKSFASGERIGGALRGNIFRGVVP